jgi:hypothetical protein
MVVDLAYLRRNIETLRRELDHRFLDEVAGLGPATLENLCAYIWRAMELVYAGKLSCVEVRREASGDRCRRGAEPAGRARGACGLAGVAVRRGIATVCPIAVGRSDFAVCFPV